MTPEHRTVFAERFKVWFKGNEAAIQACLDLLEIIHLWDDLVDNDKPIDCEHASDTMRKAMLELPLNPFWNANYLTLSPLLHSAYLQWHTANVMEEGNEETDGPKAYMLRASVYSIFAMVALLCGGMEWAREVSVEIWRTYGETPQNFRVIEGGTGA